MKYGHIIIGTTQHRLSPDTLWVICGKKIRDDSSKVTPPEVTCLANFLKLNDDSKKIREESQEKL
jgi:hypothetical protein